MIKRCMCCLVLLIACAAMPGTSNVGLAKAMRMRAVGALNPRLGLVINPACWLDAAKWDRAIGIADRLGCGILRAHYPVREVYKSSSRGDDGKLGTLSNYGQKILAELCKRAQGRKLITGVEFDPSISEEQNLRAISQMVAYMGAHHPDILWLGPNEPKALSKGTPSQLASYMNLIPKLRKVLPPGSLDGTNHGWFTGREETFSQSVETARYGEMQLKTARLGLRLGTHMYLHWTGDIAAATRAKAAVSAGLGCTEGNLYWPILPEGFDEFTWGRDLAIEVRETLKYEPFFCIYSSGDGRSGAWPEARIQGFLSVELP